jgi:hypothetical protein
LERLSPDLVRFRGEEVPRISEEHADIPERLNGGTWEKRRMLAAI